MIALMEQSAHLLAKFSLTDTQDTVGIEVNVKHTRATPLGAKVYAEAELVAIDGKKLTFKVKAFDDNGSIGEGTHIRYIINPSKYMDRLS
jgi:predicted thioesterase